MGCVRFFCEALQIGVVLKEGVVFDRLYKSVVQSMLDMAGAFFVPDGTVKQNGSSTGEVCQRVCMLNSTCAQRCV